MRKSLLRSALAIWLALAASPAARSVERLTALPPSLPGGARPVAPRLARLPRVEPAAQMPSQSSGAPVRAVARRQADQPSGAAASDFDDDQNQRLERLESAFQQFRDRLEAGETESFPSAKLTGFTQLDSYLLTQDALNKATVGDGQNGVGFRRARLATVGSVSEFTNYMLEVDFATAGRPSFFDVWLEQENLGYLGEVRIGQFCQPFSVDAMSGFRNLPFLERSLPFLAFVPFRRVGAMSSNEMNERTYWAYSVFRTGGFNNAPLGDSRFATDIGDQGGASFSTRITHLLWYDDLAKDRYLWHVGASFNYSQMTGNTASGSRPFYQARTGPEFGPIGGTDSIPPTFGPASYAASNFTPPMFIDTGRYLASGFALLGVETVWQAGPFSFQGEFMATDVLSVVGPIWYTGAYAEIMYRPTGEHRLYDRRLAALKNPLPFTEFIPLGRRGVGGWGAWEIAARLSYLDLRNPSRLLPSDYISGTNNSGNGTLTDVTVGITWMLNFHVKLQFNWIHAMLNNTQKGFSQGDFYVGRAQVDF
jgi:phosphate-selective porin OprO/OprP